MPEFEIIIFRQTRILLGSLFFIIAFLLILKVGGNIKSAILEIIFIFSAIILLAGIVFYYSFGRLKIRIKENTLNFHWNQKFFFNYKKIPSIPINEIKIMVIDKNELLRKIITEDKEILLGNGKLFKKDSRSFINYLTLMPKNSHIRVIDSWEEWKEKGFLKMAYAINSVVLIIVIAASIAFIWLTGFSSKSLLFIPLAISQLILYQLIIKNKIK